MLSPLHVNLLATLDLTRETLAIFVCIVLISRINVREVIRCRSLLGQRLFFFLNSRQMVFFFKILLNSSHLVVLYLLLSGGYLHRLFDFFPYQRFLMVNKKSIISFWLVLVRLMVLSRFFLTIFFYFLYNLRLLIVKNLKHLTLLTLFLLALFLR